MKLFPVIQKSPEWFALRRGVPTASRFDQILTAAKGQPAAAQEGLISSLIAESLIELPEGYQSDAMAAGTAMESEARDYYQLTHATGPVTEVGFAVHDCGLFGGSPDALVGEDGGLEVKCPNATTHIGYIRAGVLPREYGMQVRGYMVITGRRWWDFESYHRGLPTFCIRQVWDELTDKLAAELPIFCGRYNAERAKFNLPSIIR